MYFGHNRNHERFLTVAVRFSQKVLFFPFIYNHAVFVSISHPSNAWHLNFNKRQSNLPAEYSSSKLCGHYWRWNICHFERLSNLCQSTKIGSTVFQEGGVDKKATFVVDCLISFSRLHPNTQYWPVSISLTLNRWGAGEIHATFNCDWTACWKCG